MNTRPEKLSSQVGTQSGFSLLGAMALLAVLTLVIYAWSRTQSRSVKVQNLIRAKNSVQDVRQAVEGKIIQKFRTDACFDPSSAFAGAGLGSLGTMTYSTAVMSGVNIASIDSSAMITRLTAARARCRNPRPPGTSATMAANTHRYFCVEFERGAGAPGGSFMASRGAFAEVFVESRNFQTGQPVDCRSINSRTDGGVILYSIYWPGTGADKNTWQFFNASLQVVAESCEASLNYSPQSIQCSVPFSVNDSIWERVGSEYNRRWNFMRDFDSLAEVISPEATERHPGLGSQMCGLVPGVDELVYVTHLNVPTTGEYSVASLIDDFGYIYFWKDGNPSNQIRVNGNNTVEQKINLVLGQYVVVVTANDRGQTTNGMGLSVKRVDTGDVVLRSTKAGNSWCIFRAAHAGLDLSTFVPEAAKCLPCYEGTSG